MSDPVDRLPCQDVVCARGGHFVCHDMPPPTDKQPLMGADIPMRDHHRDTVALRGDDDE